MDVLKAGVSERSFKERNTVAKGYWKRGGLREREVKGMNEKWVWGEKKGGKADDSER